MTDGSYQDSKDLSDEVMAIAQILAELKQELTDVRKTTSALIVLEDTLKKGYLSEHIDREVNYRIREMRYDKYDKGPPNPFTLPNPFHLEDPEPVSQAQERKNRDHLKEMKEKGKTSNLTEGDTNKLATFSKNTEQLSAAARAIGEIRKTNASDLSFGYVLLDLSKKDKNNYLSLAEDKETAVYKAKSALESKFQDRSDAEFPYTRSVKLVKDRIFEDATEDGVRDAQKKIAESAPEQINPFAQKVIPNIASAPKENQR